MFKKLVPVLGVLLLAGPVFAADAPPAQGAPAAAPAGDQKAMSKKHHKHHKKTADAPTAPPAK